jgi:hypothetical protein
MPATCEQLESLLESLEADRPVVAYALRRAAEGLRGRGGLTLAAAVEGAREFHARFVTLQRRLSSALQESDQNRKRPAEAPPTLAIPESLPELRNRLDWLRKREEFRRTLALLRELRAATPAADPALERIRIRADEWEAELGPWAPEKTTGGELRPQRDDEHPAAALLNLLRDKDQLSDSDWDACVALVRSAFGDGVATAVIRGRLLLPRTSPAPKVPVPHPDSHDLLCT